jgi:hypothetical protein
MRVSAVAPRWKTAPDAMVSSMSPFFSAVHPDNAMSRPGTNLPIRNVRFHGESWRVKQTCRGHAKIDANDPKRTFGSTSCSASITSKGREYKYESDNGHHVERPGEANGRVVKRE